MKIENTKAQMRKGVLELCILSIISEREAYPSDIIKKLKEYKLIVVEGTLYPLLSRLKNAELLAYHRESITTLLTMERDSWMSFSVPGVSSITLCLNPPKNVQSLKQVLKTSDHSLCENSCHL